MEEKITFLLQEQHEEAITMLYDNYSEAIFGIILRIVRCPHTAQNVMQDCFVKVWTYSSDYDPSKGRVFTWLLNIARNTAIDETRRTGWKINQKTEDLSPVMAHKLDPINAETIDLRELVVKLDPKHSVLVEMVYFQGYTQEQVAQEFDMPLGTVKTRLRTAISELRKVLHV